MNLRLHALGTYDIHDIHGIHEFSSYTPWHLRYSRHSRYSRIHGLLRPYSPATVMPSIRTEPHWREPRTTTSDPIAAMLRYISFRLPATVISWTGCDISPFWIQKPAAPRE